MVGNTVSLFREASEHLDGHLATIIFGGAVVVTAMLAVPLAKKCERKTLLGISALGVTACLFSLGAFYYLKVHYENDVKQFGWVALVDFLIYTGFFMVSTFLCTVFENHRKSLIQHCEPKELGLHFERWHFFENL